MKKIFTILVVVLLNINVFAQAPQLISYQAVIRNSKDSLVRNHDVGMRVSILQGSNTGTIVYEEIYNPNPKTNANGLLTLEIGGGTSVYGTFSDINWSNGPYYIKIETDPTGGVSYSISGTSKLLSVPYALSALSASSLSITGTTGQTLMNNGITWAASSKLYNNGTNVGIGTSNPSPSAIIDLSSSTQGVLVPRMTTVQMNAISVPVNGLLIYNTDCNNFYYNSGTPGSPNWAAINSFNKIGTPGYISGSTNVCGNQAGVPYSVAAVSGATSYNWTIPSEATITAGTGTNSITVTFGNNSGNVCVSAVNSCGISNASCISVMVSGLLTAGTISSNQTICSGESTSALTFITLPTSGTGYFSYQWYNDSGSLGSTATNSTYSPGILTSSTIVTTESFDGPTFPPTGWYTKVINNPDCPTTPPTYCPFAWMRTTKSITVVPPQSPHSGAGEAWYDSYDAASGDEAILVSPSFSETGNISGASVSFWMYGDTYYNVKDLINVYYSTSPTQPTSTVDATLLGTAYRYGDANGWYQYTYTIPGSVTSSTVWLIFDAISANGEEMYIDDVSWTSIPLTSSKNYYCGITNGTCGMVNTNTVTISVNALPTASASGTTTICNGNSATLTASGVGSYLWNTGAATSAITVSPTNSTSYTVTVTNTKGCFATANATVTVNNGSPPPPVAGTTAAGTGTTVIVWNWNTVSEATGYKWGTTNNYSSAIDVGSKTSHTQKKLTCNTSYTAYVWAYNTCGNSTVTTLIQMTSACFPCGSILTDDRDNQTYNTVLIGTQCWTSQNINYGTFVPIFTGENATGTQKYCYGDDQTNCTTYGGLYEWQEMMDGVNLNNTAAAASICNGTAPPPVSNVQCSEVVQGICPSGWHIPAYYEWVLLEQNVGSCASCFPYNTTGGTLGVNEGANLLSGGSSGFNALLGGRATGGGTINGDFSFGPTGTGATLPMGAFWCSSGSNNSGSFYAWSPLLWPSQFPGQIYDTSSSTGAGAFGYSVRCIND